jgi:D-serine dehydratase
MTKAIYKLVHAMNFNRQELRALVKEQIKMKSLKHKAKTITEISEIQRSLSLRKEMINDLHKTIEEYKAILRKYPRGKDSLVIYAGQLSELLTELKKEYKEEATNQYVLKKSLSSIKNFESIAEFALAQRKKMEKKIVINEVAQKRKNFKEEYKEVSDLIYNQGKAV